jgi:hypothetical protein
VYRVVKAAAKEHGTARGAMRAYRPQSIGRAAWKEINEPHECGSDLSSGPLRQCEKGSAMTRGTIDYKRLGIETCEAFAEGPEAFADFVRTILSIAAPLHVLQTSHHKRPEALDAFMPLSETRH